jgi:hypothetical protein
MSKIAPVLREFIAASNESDSIPVEILQELRALLAVARAAKKQQARGIPSWPEADALRRSLARLEKVSR